MPNSRTWSLKHLTDSRINAISNELLKKIIKKRTDTKGGLHDSHTSGHSKNNASTEIKNIEINQGIINNG